MAQRQITINAYPLIECGPNSFAVTFEFERKNAHEALRHRNRRRLQSRAQSLCRRTRTNRQALAPKRPVRQELRAQAGRLRQSQQRPRA